jgi:hypothetical protein
VLKDLQTVLETQHRLLDSLLLEAVRHGSSLDELAYAAFRETLAQHIALEERYLLAALKDIGFEYGLAARFHADHGTLGRLMAAPPSMENAGEIARVLRPHEVLEEADVGLFAVCARTLDDATLKRVVRETSLKRSDSAILSGQAQTRADAFALAVAHLAAAEPPEG